MLHHLHMIRALLMRAGWIPADADRRVALLASMGARLLLVGALGGCYSLPARYTVRADGPCNTGDTDEGATGFARRCRRVTP